MAKIAIAAPLAFGVVAFGVMSTLAACSTRGNRGAAAMDGGSGTSGAGGAAASAGSAGNAGTAANGAGGDTCDGSPCASHTGSHAFVEPSAPANAADLFSDGTAQAHGTNAGHEPSMVYPAHETMFPINVSRIRHEWRAGDGNRLFRLTFAGANTNVTVHTAELNWLPSAEQWDWIAESNRGGSVELTVAALDTQNPTLVWQSKPITLYFSALEVDGAIYYWSTGTEGVMRARVSDPVPEKFYTDPQGTDSGTCVACHTLSRDGKRMSMGYGGERLREINVDDRSLILTQPDKPVRAAAWSTFSPDGEMLLVAANGTLTLIDSDTGDTIGPNNGLVALPQNTVGTNPDWNPAGDKVVFALGTKGGNKDVEGGSIAILPWDGAAFGPAEVLVPNAGNNDNNFFPMWSPDGRWIAFVNATGKSKDQVTATLKLVAASGGTPRTMTRLNQRVNDEDGIIDIGNTMPTWAPATRPGIFWLAFSSLRAYASLRPQDAKEDQIWIAAIDPSSDTDPSYAGFWAPFQDLDAGNHRAFWTHTETDTQCLCAEICGDNVDNNCNGVADEPACVATCEPGVCNVRQPDGDCGGGGWPPGSDDAGFGMPE